MENDNVIRLPEFKEKKKKLKTIGLPVKNFLLYRIRILSANVKPKKFKIAGSKSMKYPLPIELINIQITNQSAIDSLMKSTPRATINYTNIFAFGSNKMCELRLAPTHYKVLRAWLIENGVSIGQEIAFERRGISTETKMWFMTKEQADMYIKKIDEKESKKTKK